MPLSDEKVNDFTAKLDHIALLLDQGKASPAFAARHIRQISAQVRDASHKEGLHA